MFLYDGNFRIMEHFNGQDHDKVGNGSPAPFYQIQVAFPCMFIFLPVFVF
jgi:hypothetical protein